MSNYHVYMYTCEKSFLAAKRCQKGSHLASSLGISISKPSGNNNCSCCMVKLEIAKKG